MATRSRIVGEGPDLFPGIRPEYGQYVAPLTPYDETKEKGVFTNIPEVARQARANEIPVYQIGQRPTPRPTIAQGEQPPPMPTQQANAPTTMQGPATPMAPSAEAQAQAQEKAPERPAPMIDPFNLANPLGRELSKEELFRRNFVLRNPNATSPSDPLKRQLAQERQQAASMLGQAESRQREKEAITFKTDEEIRKIREQNKGRGENQAAADERKAQLQKDLLDRKNKAADDRQRAQIEARSQLQDKIFEQSKTLNGTYTEKVALIREQMKAKDAAKTAEELQEAEMRLWDMFVDHNEKLKAAFQPEVPPSEFIKSLKELDKEFATSGLLPTPSAGAATGATTTQGATPPPAGTAPQPPQGLSTLEEYGIDRVTGERLSGFGGKDITGDNQPESEEDITDAVRLMAKYPDKNAYAKAFSANNRGTEEQGMMLWEQAKAIDSAIKQRNKAWADALIERVYNTSRR